MEFATVKIHRHKLKELRMFKAKLMGEGRKVSDAETIETAIGRALKNENATHKIEENREFEHVLRGTQEAFSDFTEKDWKEFERGARIKWKPADLSF